MGLGYRDYYWEGFLWGVLQNPYLQSLLNTKLLDGKDYLSSVAVSQAETPVFAS